MKKINKLSSDQKAMMGTAIYAVVKAGQAIMNIYATEFDVEHKEDKSPLTLADRESHAVINRVLSTVWPEIDIISEEGTHITFEQRKGWKKCWIVDPLDGTKGFTRRNDEFAVCIAYVEKGQPLLGVIYGPVKGDLYIGIPGSGVWSQDCSACETLIDGDVDTFSRRDAQLVFETFKETLTAVESVDAASSDIPVPLRVIASKNHLNRETEEFITSLKEQYKEISIVNIGSALKFCMLANGKADIYPRYAPTCEWDTAAGQAIVEAIGGSVIQTENRKPLVYNKEDLLNPWFVAARNPLLLD
jgi:3'(2'), 5'-bisphosphate nucleotidase